VNKNKKLIERIKDFFNCLAEQHYHVRLFHINPPPITKPPPPPIVVYKEGNPPKPNKKN